MDRIKGISRNFRRNLSDFYRKLANFKMLRLRLKSWLRILKAIAGFISVVKLFLQLWRWFAN